MLSNKKRYALVAGSSFLADIVSKKIPGTSQDQGHDALLPIIGVFVASMLASSEDTYIAHKTALGLFGAYSLAEICQNLHLYQGVYDPSDFLAYGVGAIAAVGIHKLVTKRETTVRKRKED